MHSGDFSLLTCTGVVLATGLLVQDVLLLFALSATNGTWHLQFCLEPIKDL